MKIAKAIPRTSLVDVLDRVLDKGVVIDAWVQVSVIGIDIIEVKARVVVASISTYVRLSGAVKKTALAAQPFEAESPALPPPRPAAPPGRRIARARGRRRSTATVPLVRCRDGCTFRRQPGAVRCPYHRGRRCELTAA